MITGHGGEQPAAYSPLVNRLLAFCAALDTAPLTEGRYDFFPDEDIVVLINERVTEPADRRPAEVHRHYAELHYVVGGGECIGYYPEDGANEISADLLEEKDALLYKNRPDVPEVLLPLAPGDYAVFFPQDVHRPFCVRPQNGGAPESIKKIVIKFPANGI